VLIRPALFFALDSSPMKPDPSVRQWLDGAARIPLLTAAEELHLGAIVRRWQDHPEGPGTAPTNVQRRGLRARNRIVEANLRLVHLVATRYKGRADMADMLQSGAIGLTRAAEKFDPERGYKFSTYAYFWIRQAIQRGESDEFTISIPYLIIEKTRFGREVDLSPESVAAAKMAYSVMSLDAPTPGGDLGDSATLADLLPGGSLDADGLAWGEALEAAQAADRDGVALLSLHRIDRASQAELAGLEGVDAKAMASRIRATAGALRSLPQVAAVLAG